MNTRTPSTAAGFRFADGHAEIRRWRDARTIQPVRRETISTRKPAPSSIDVAWLQDRTTARENDSARQESLPGSRQKPVSPGRGP